MKNKDIELLLFSLRFLKSSLDKELLKCAIEDGFLDSEKDIESLIEKIENTVKLD